MQNEIKPLLFLFTTGRCSKAQIAILRQWAEGNPQRQALLSHLGDSDYVNRNMIRRELVSTGRPMQYLQRHIAMRRNRRMLRISAIAASVMIACTVAFFLFTRSLSPLDSTLSATTPPDNYLSFSSLTPGRTCANLTGSTGETISLSASDTTIRASALIHKEKISTPGKSSQSVAAADPSPSLCLTVPRGGEFKITLSDSSTVWLNSESMLRFPEEFNGDERRVILQGEAYFAVTPDTSRPFIIESDGGHRVTVHGTTFNIRAYPEDPLIYTTLESGSVSLTRTDMRTGEVLLSPGQQALFDKKEKALDIRHVDTGVITGWRHGRFVFEEQPLANIMRDLARWYDFDYEFADPSLAGIIFMGSIPRYSDFSAARRIL